MTYRNEHRDSRPVILPTIRGLEEPQEKVSEGRTSRCRGAEYREELSAIRTIHPTCQQRGCQCKCSGRCKPFELAKVNRAIGTYNRHTFVNYESSKDNQRQLL